MVQRQCRLVADLLEREAGFYAGYAGYPGQVSLQELLVGGKVGNDHAQQIVGFPVIR